MNKDNEAAETMLASLNNKPGKTVSVAKTNDADFNKFVSEQRKTVKKQ